MQVGKKREGRKAFVTITDSRLTEESCCKRRATKRARERPAGRRNKDKAKGRRNDRRDRVLLVKLQSDGPTTAMQLASPTDRPTDRPLKAE